MNEPWWYMVGMTICVFVIVGSILFAYGRAIGIW